MRMQGECGEHRRPRSSIFGTYGPLEFVILFITVYIETFSFYFVLNKNTILIIITIIIISLIT